MARQRAFLGLLLPPPGAARCLTPVAPVRKPTINGADLQSGYVRLRNLAETTVLPAGKRIPGLKLDNRRQPALMKSDGSGASQRFHLVRLNADFFHTCHEARLHPPYALAVVADRAVGVEDRLARPCARVAPERAHAVLRIDVGLVIGEQEEGIMIDQVFDDRTEQFGIAAAERAAGDEVDHFAQLRVLLVMTARLP